MTENSFQSTIAPGFLRRWIVASTIAAIVASGVMPGVQQGRALERDLPATANAIAWGAMVPILWAGWLFGLTLDRSPGAFVPIVLLSIAIASVVNGTVTGLLLVWISSRPFNYRPNNRKDSNVVV